MPHIGPPLFQTIVEVPFALTVGGSCLGTTLTATLDGAPAELCLPGFEQTSSDFPEIITPPALCGYSAEDWRSRIALNTSWGVATSVRKDQPFEVGGSARVSHVLVNVQLTQAQVNNAQSLANAYTRAIRAWMLLLAEWIEVINESWVARSGASGEASITFGSGQCWLHDGSSINRLTQTIFVSAPPMNGARSLEIDDLHLALQLAGTGSSPPAEWLYLRNARAGLARNDTRRAILDAATAAEIALTKLLEIQIAPAAPALQSIVRSNNSNLGQLARTLRKHFKLPLRSDIEQSLAKPRNNAIHSGEVTTRNIAQTAINIAAELVELATSRTHLLASASQTAS